VPHPPRVASYLILFICFLNPTDIEKGPPSTTIGGRRASQEGFWGGGFLRQTLRTMPKRRIIYQSGVDLGFGLVDVYLKGSVCQPPW
jgi:hypothetical protein